VYLAVVLDVFSRKIIGWSLGRSLKAQLPICALERAIANRRPLPGVVHHSDQGVQYACSEYIHAKAPGAWDAAQYEQTFESLGQRHV
jgi:transposase InsO family protein